MVMSTTSKMPVGRLALGWPIYCFIYSVPPPGGGSFFSFSGVVELPAYRYCQHIRSACAAHFINRFYDSACSQQRARVASFQFHQYIATPGAGRDAGGDASVNKLVRLSLTMRAGF